MLTYSSRQKKAIDLKIERSAAPVWINARDLHK